MSFTTKIFLLCVFPINSLKNYTMNQKNNFFSVIFLLFIACFSFAQTDTTNIEQDYEDEELELLNGPLDCIQAPTNYVLSTLFHGYENDVDSSALSIFDVPGVNFVQLSKAYEESVAQDPELQLVSISNFTSASGVEGKLLKINYDEEGVPFTSYFLFAGDMYHTIWILINHPTSRDSNVSSAILSSLQTLDL